MNKTSSSDQLARLQKRLATAEFNIARLSETLYDLIERLQGIPDPPCPPMCGFAAETGKRTAKKLTSKKKRS